MRKNPSGIKEIARRAGVHHSTISRVLNPQTRSLVSGKVATNILHIAEALGYRRNSMAVGPQNNRALTIGWAFGPKNGKRPGLTPINSKNRIPASSLKKKKHNYTMI